MTVEVEENFTSKYLVDWKIAFWNKIALITHMRPHIHSVSQRKYAACKKRQDIAWTSERWKYECRWRGQVKAHVIDTWAARGWFPSLSLLAPRGLRIFPVVKVENQGSCRSTPWCFNPTHSLDDISFIAKNSNPNHIPSGSINRRCSWESIASNHGAMAEALRSRRSRPPPL